MTLSWAGYLFVLVSTLLIGHALWVRLRSSSLRGRAVDDLADLFPGLANHQGRAAVYCHSAHCIPCRRLGPGILRLQEKHAGLYRLDVGSHAAAARRLGVQATPTTLLVEDGRVLKVILGDPLAALDTFLQNG